MHEALQPRDYVATANTTTDNNKQQQDNAAINNRYVFFQIEKWKPANYIKFSGYLIWRIENIWRGFILANNTMKQNFPVLQR